ncbi:MAG: hypothetical protein GC164_14010 [Phycisphaera sp.]|nr:hypothetical protein [Phycisphaera sp.]
MLLVLLAVTLAAVLSLSFLAGQSTSVGLARNLDHVTDARAIAESGMVATLDYIKNNSDWRTAHTSGTWLTGQACYGGTYDVIVEDGRDTDGDGTVEGDGDLADDSTDVATVTVIGRYNGVAYKLQNVVSATSTLTGSITVLMVVSNSSSLTQAEQTRKDLIESWGWTVALIDTGASQASYDAAVESAHVVYVPDDGGTNLVGTKLAGVELGVIYDDGDMNSPLGLSTSQTSYTGNTIKIVDNTHYVTSPFAIGDLQISTTSSRVEALSGSVAGAARPLGWWPNTTTRVLATLETGASEQDGSPSPGRRAIAPFAGVNADKLTSDGQTLLKRLLEWGAQSAMASDSVEALTNWTTSSTVNLVNGEDRLLVVTVGAETVSSLTSITYGYQEMTLAVSAFQSTGVGARSYIYYLTESGLAAASDNRIRTTWTSGSRDDTSTTARLYQHVSQASPIRTTAWAENAGPQTITCTPMSVAKGDYAISAVRVGNPSQSYTWTSPMIEGIEDKLSTSTHSCADYAVPSGVTEVTAETSCPGPNRQAMVAAVLQPRSTSSGSGVIPQLLVLYEFNEQQPTADLVGHWKLDDDGSGGAIAMGDVFQMNDNAVIDGYHGTAGAYGGNNQHLPVTVVTNTSGNGSIDMNNSATLYGATYNRPGANPTNVVSLSSGATITGNRYEQSIQASIPGASAPTGMPSAGGNQVYNNGNYTLSSDAKFSKITVNNGATITINGNVRLESTGDFTMNGGTFVINPGSKLRLYVGGNVDIKNSSIINSDSTAASRFELYQYSSNKTTTISKTAIVSGVLYSANDLYINDDARVYGAVYVADDFFISDNARLSIDLDMTGFHIVPVKDDTGSNDAQMHNTATFGQGGARSFTGSSMRFDGSSFVLINHNDAYLLNHATISFWFYPESLSGTKTLISKDSSGYDTGGQFTVYTSGSTLTATLQSNGSSPYGTGNDFTVSTSGLSTNTWYHVTLTFGAGGLRLYLNGTLKSTTAYPGSLGTSSGGIGNYEPLVLGAGTTTSGDLTHLPLNNFFTGRIDDVCIYNAVLDATQVSRIYQGQAVGSRTEPSYLVYDTSGLGNALDMFIDDTQAVSWVAGGGLTLNTATVLRAASTPDKIRNGISATGEFTLEFTTKPKTLSGTGSLLWYGPTSGNNVNIDYSRSSAHHAARIRTSDTGNNPSAFAGSDSLITSGANHMLLTYDGEKLRYYLNGVLSGEQATTGDMLNWDSSYGLTVGNKPMGGNAWLGTISRVAIYDRAMNQKQVLNLNDGLPPGDGADSQEGFAVEWTEKP